MIWRIAVAVLDAEQMDRLHDGALKGLERTGLQIQGEFLLRALADAGCRVDFAAHRAWFPPDLVERQIAAQRGRYRMVRSSLWHPFCRELPRRGAAVRSDSPWTTATPRRGSTTIPQRRYRKPTVAGSDRHDPAGQRAADASRRSIRR